jgi:hypothetical protein
MYTSIDYPMVFVFVAFEQLYTNLCHSNSRVHNDNLFNLCPQTYRRRRRRRRHHHHRIHIYAALISCLSMSDMMTQRRKKKKLKKMMAAPSESVVLIVYNTLSTMVDRWNTYDQISRSQLNCNVRPHMCNSSE